MIKRLVFLIFIELHELLYQLFLLPFDLDLDLDW